MAGDLYLALVQMKKRRGVHIDDIDIVFNALENYESASLNLESPFVDDREVLRIVRDGLIMAGITGDWSKVQIVIQQIETVVNHRV